MHASGCMLAFPVRIEIDVVKTHGGMWSISRSKVNCNSTTFQPQRSLIVRYGLLGALALRLCTTVRRIVSAINETFSHYVYKLQLIGWAIVCTSSAIVDHFPLCFPLFPPFLHPVSCCKSSSSSDDVKVDAKGIYSHWIKKWNQTQPMGR